MKLFLKVFIVLLVLPAVVFAQDDEDWPSLSYLRSDYKAVAVVAHIRIQHAEITSRIIGYENWTIRAEVIEPFKGKFKKGDVIRKFSSDDKPTPVNLETLNIPAYWVRTPETLSSAAGMHRWLWDLRPTAPARPTGRGGAQLVLPGSYTVRLTVAGQTYTQPLIVKMDPRSK